MRADEDVFAFGDEQFARSRVQIPLHAILFLFQAFFGLLEIIRHGIFGDKRLGLVLIIHLRATKERNFEMFLVIVERSLVQVAFVDTKGDERVHDLLDQTLIDCLAVSLAFDQTQDRASELCLLSLDMEKEICTPLDKGELLNL